MIIKKILFTFFILLITSMAGAYELTRLSSKISIVPAGTVNKTKAFGIATQIIAPDSVTAYIPFNRKVTILSFSVLVPEKSILYMKWDNSKNFFSRMGRQIKFRRAGAYRSVSFNATKVGSGNIYFYNANNKLLGKVHYNIKKQNKYSQRIRATLNESETSSTDRSTLGLSYTIRKKVSNGAPQLSLSVSASGDLNETDRKSISTSVSYSW